MDIIRTTPMGLTRKPYLVLSEDGRTSYEFSWSDLCDWLWQRNDQPTALIQTVWQAAKHLRRTGWILYERV